MPYGGCFIVEEWRGNDSPRGIIRKWIPIARGSSHHKSSPSLDIPTPVHHHLLLCAAAFSKPQTPSEMIMRSVKRDSSPSFKSKLLPFLPQFIIINSGVAHIPAAEQNMPSETVNIEAHNL